MADLTLNIISNMSGATAQVNEFTNAMKRATSAVSSTGAAVKKTGSAVSTAAAHVAKLGHSANKTAGFFGKLNRSLARIAVYRTMRKAISYVGEAFKTGLEAAYQFSKANQPAEYAKLAGAMDGIKKAASTMSLQLGAAFGGLITAVAPILIRIINLVTAAADAITRFFAVLNGTGYYKKASEGFEEVGNSAGGAGKKIKGLLASWDELNVIGKESGGGGGGSSATDYSGAYVWAEAESDWANLFASGDFFGIGAKIGDALGNISKKITEFLKKPEIQNFGKNLADTLNGLVSDPKNWENFGETIGTFIGTLGNIINDFIANTNWADVKTALVAFWEGLKAAFDETYNGVDLLGTINILINGWLADLPAKAKNAGIKFTNALITEVENGLNDLIRIYNESFGWLLGDIDPVYFELIPEIPEEELNKNWNSAKKTIEELFKNNPAKATVSPEVTEPEQKLGPEKFFSHGKVVGEGYAYVIVPQLKEKLNISDWLSGNGSGHNDGVYSTGNGLALTLSVIPSLGDRSKLAAFNDEVEENVTKDRWFSANPYTPEAKVRTFNQNTTRTISFERRFEANPYTPEKNVKTFNNNTSRTISFERRFETNPYTPESNVRKFNENTSSQITFARRFAANPETAPKKINEFNQNVKEKVTYSRDFNTNPVLKVLKTYKDAMGDLTDAKTVDIKPKLTDVKAFKEQLQSALKASASIKSTVSGTTTTIGKVSMSEYAQGGWPNIGDLFIANEAGPELVGTIGGSTAVANNDDIVQGIQGGVERANAEQNELLRNIYSGVVKLLEKDLTISPSVALGQVVARSTALYGRA